jgi:hypothetical protein
MEIALYCLSYRKNIKDMADTFILPLQYQGEDKEFDCQLRAWGYTYRIAVDLGGSEVLFEPDEEGKFRAAAPDGAQRKENQDIGLLSAIAEQLQFYLKEGS